MYLETPNSTWIKLKKRHNRNLDCLYVHPNVHKPLGTGHLQVFHTESKRSSTHLYPTCCTCRVVPMPTSANASRSHCNSRGGTHLRQSNVRYDNAMQSARGILGGLVFVPTRMVLVFEVLIRVLALRARCLPRHGTFGHAYRGFRG